MSGGEIMGFVSGVLLLLTGAWLRDELLVVVGVVLLGILVWP